MTVFPTGQGWGIIFGDEDGYGDKVLSLKAGPIFNMEMKKISYAVLIAVASMSAAMAAETVNSVAPAPSPNIAASPLVGRP
ncbi:hypothetical protein EZV62_022625 [Acer yangbiense]|uniref:Uncharacterized protein n=1 Tax=Acer yangbiense TaxID=1000413 RepID=A0A5C7HBC9_9ROSI|nr:hypothetical protein EZV62_022625 [Acer yangbiense]